jgi:uncharacterized YigZ family protein
MEYKTIAGPSSACLVEKRSKFIASVAPVDNEADAQQFIAEIRAKNPDARHEVFAYVLKGGIRRCSDDGEPQGTAGMPVLEAISRRGLVNVAAVVTRYFGGVLLGAPGLLRAYSGAATLALDSAETAVMQRCLIYRVNLGYGMLDRFERLAAEYAGHVGQTVYKENVELSVMIPDKSEADFLFALAGISGGMIKPLLEGETYSV